MPFSLILGLGCAGFTLGYMVGGSGSPVVGAVAPSLIGIALIAFSVLQKAVLQDLLKKSTTDTTGPEALGAVVDQLKTEVRRTSRHVGWGLVALFTTFFLGSNFGAVVRINRYLILAPEAATPGLPWDETSTPADLAEAVLKINTATSLRRLGYTDAQILQVAVLPPPAPGGGPREAEDNGAAGATGLVHTNDGARSPDLNIVVPEPNPQPTDFPFPRPSGGDPFANRPDLTVPLSEANLPPGGGLTDR